jgi:hypothetical protein
MRRILDFTVDEVTPDQVAVFEALELGQDKKPSERIAQLVDGAFATFQALARPRGVFETITVEEFVSVYPGEGLNESKTPLAEIYPQADRLALFAVTLGPEVGRCIEELFGDKDFALGYVLDSVASEAAECTADRLEEKFDGYLTEIGAKDSSSTHLRYSPGYCGWHISGQRNLFGRLHPEEIGIELNESFLMQPLKSISGIFVFGEREIHLFNNSYRFCAECTTVTCRERLRHIVKT